MTIQSNQLQTDVRARTTPLRQLPARRLLTAVSLASLLLIPLNPANASGPHGGHHNPERMLDHLGEKLDLSQPQETSIRALLAASQERSAADWTRLREVHKSLHQQQNNFDPGAAQTLADELGQLTAKVAYEKASTQAQIYQQLNPAQRAEMEKLQQERETRRGGHGRHRGQHADED